jgi:small subunit ribosomal protein S9
VSEPTQTLNPADAAASAEEGEHVSEYTTETGDTPAGGPAKAAATRKPVVTGSAMGTGRRKEAIARVRIVPGSGRWRTTSRTRCTSSSSASRS